MVFDKREPFLRNLKKQQIMTPKLNVVCKMQAYKW